MGLRDGRGSREAERLTKVSDPKDLIRTIPAKGAHPVGLVREPAEERGQDLAHANSQHGYPYGARTGLRDVSRARDGRAWFAVADTNRFLIDL